MNIKVKNIITIVLLGLIILISGLMLLFGNKKVYSQSERRKLESFPEITFDNIRSGSYMTAFESALKDNFPLRDSLRTVKAHTSKTVFNQLDNNGFYACRGHISRLLYPLKYEMLDFASEKFFNIYKIYFENTDAEVYFSIVPDKNMFLGENYLTIDYYQLFEYMKQKNNYMNYIDITDLLSADDYYNTDTHWKQESIADVADRIAGSMGTELENNFKQSTASDSFYGVYYGQSALWFKPDSINYLSNNIIENCKVTIYPNGKPLENKVYDYEKLNGKDPYEFFLSGSQSIVKIDNPDCKNNKKLIIFRDSFASSLAPLLISGYKNITLIDTRYINPAYLNSFIDIEADDVLFIYSTLILNSSLGIR